MRKSKILEIEGLGEVTIKEVSPYAVYTACMAENTVEEIMKIAEDCVSLSSEKLQKLYPSEIEQITETFIEVNNSFLAIAARLGIKKTLVNIASEISNNFPPLFAESFKTAMVNLPGITAGASS